MPAQYIEAPHVAKQENSWSVFFAGPISRYNWQKLLLSHIRDLEITIYNPRREIMDASSNTYVQQIAWESTYVRDSDSIAFWFGRETLCPITLFELGSALERGTQMLWVGIDLKYARKVDIEERLKHAKPVGIFHGMLPVVYSLDDLAQEIRIYCTGQTQGGG